MNGIRWRRLWRAVVYAYSGERMMQNCLVGWVAGALCIIFEVDDKPYAQELLNFYGALGATMCALYALYLWSIRRIDEIERRRRRRGG